MNKVKVSSTSFKVMRNLYGMPALAVLNTAEIWCMKKRCMNAMETSV